MSELDTNIVDAFEQLRDFCQQVSLLLGSVKLYLEKEHWTRAGTNSTVCDDTSAALDDPRR